MIPSFARATANLILHEQRQDRRMRTVGVARHGEALGGVGSPARADVHVVDFLGHHGQFGHQLNRVAALQHGVTLREAQLHLEEVHERG